MKILIIVLIAGVNKKEIVIAVEIGEKIPRAED